MEIMVEGSTVTRYSEATANMCIQDYQQGCGAYCNCDCNGDH